MKKALAVIAFLLPALFSCEYVLAQQAIPPSFFGIHVNNPTLNGQSSYPLGHGSSFTHGEFRNWAVHKVRCHNGAVEIPGTEMEYLKVGSMSDIAIIRQ